MQVRRLGRVERKRCLYLSVPARLGTTGEVMGSTGRQQARGIVAWLLAPVSFRVPRHHDGLLAGRVLDGLLGRGAGRASRV